MTLSDTYSGKTRRPASLEELSESRKLMWTERARQHGLAFRAQPTDVFLCPFGKCGTTWLQQIVHGLRTGGDMDFDDISRVVPWLERAYDLGLDLEVAHSAHPRAFKSHLCWDDIPKGARYIVSIRDPKDALVSMYRFNEDWWFERGSIPISSWARTRYFANPEANYWKHLASWWEHRHDENVLMLSYEGMKQTLPEVVRRIARFIGCDCDDALLKLVTRQASFDFMLHHKDKFDARLVRERSEKIAGLPTGSDTAKVRKGRVGEHKHELPATICEEMDHIWRKTIEARFGYASYDCLRVALEHGAYRDDLRKDPPQLWQSLPHQAVAG